MFDQIDRLYFEMRAKEEREKEQSATNRSAARLHRFLADEYERKAAAPEPVMVQQAGQPR